MAERDGDGTGHTGEDDTPDRLFRDLLGVETLWMFLVAGAVTAVAVLVDGGTWLSDLLPMTVTPTAVLATGALMVLIFWESKWSRREDWPSRRVRLLCGLCLMISAFTIVGTYLFVAIEGMSDIVIDEALLGGLVAAGAVLAPLGMLRLGWSLLREKVPEKEKPEPLDARYHWGLAFVALPTIGVVLAVLARSGSDLALLVSVPPGIGIALSIWGLKRSWATTARWKAAWLLAATTLAAVVLLAVLAAAWE